MTKKTKTKRVLGLIGALLVSAFVLLLIFWDKIMGSDEGSKADVTGLQSAVKSQIGLHEYTEPGESNPEVEKFFKHFGLNHETDQTAWCAASANYLLDTNGYHHAEKSQGLSILRARDLEDAIGSDIELSSLAQHAVPYFTVVVGWRDSKQSGKGHVGFYVSHTDTHIRIAGGNQSDMFTDNYLFPKSKITRVFNPVKK